MPLPYNASTAETDYGMPAGGYQNLDGVAKVDASTDMDASEGNQLLADVAQLTATPTKCWAIFTTAATTGALALVSHGAMWGTGTPPQMTRVSAGVFKFAWPSTVNDPLGVSKFVALAWGRASAHQAAFAQVQARKTAINEVTVYTFSAGVAADLVGTEILVQAG